MPDKYKVEGIDSWHPYRRQMGKSRKTFEAVCAILLAFCAAVGLYVLIVEFL